MAERTKRLFGLVALGAALNLSFIGALVILSGL